MLAPNVIYTGCDYISSYLFLKYLVLSSNMFMRVFRNQIKFLNKNNFLFN